jgi:hypothetical protein
MDQVAGRQIQGTRQIFTGLNEEVLSCYYERRCVSWVARAKVRVKVSLQIPRRKAASNDPAVIKAARGHIRIIL